MHKSTKEKINIEIKNIDNLIKEMEPLFLKIQSEDTFNSTELYAAAAFLHSFYNGIEKILKIISKDHYSKNITGKKWHKNLLLFAKDRILKKSSINLLEDYMGFRHFFRHAYTFQIKYKYIKKLIYPLQKRWENIKKEIRTFCKKKS
ncbi:MAG: hypothetical protein FXF47_05095 [Candidatus Mcinerneyibacterium aminivorans]|uniref:HepT-like domain-containing protein n=1 Tax=Candidatus Mcinerneyibacterium aminivorans TaxID=2703815 RepID=A0A5D0MI23_9BACT|nr:MAG: hypothetical protein FXF47_05095 [Candidatus Mcinerneyibacterium aminivorans]